MPIAYWLSEVLFLRLVDFDHPSKIFAIRLKNLHHWLSL